MESIYYPENQCFRENSMYYGTRQFEVLNSDVGYLEKPLPRRSKNHVTYNYYIVFRPR